MDLRDYQTRAIAQLRVVWRERCVLVAPTGSGKTVIAAAIIKGAVDKGRRAMIVSHTRAIVLQTVDRFRDAGLETGCIMGEETEGEDAPVLVASIQTLAARKLRPEIDVLIIDEVHRATSKTYADLIEHYGGKAAVIGLTATPCRLDGRGLRDVGFQALVEPVSYAELFKSGALVKPIMYAPPGEPDMTKARVVGGEFAGPVMDEAARTITGCVVSHYNEFAPGSRAVAFGVNVEHAQQIAEAFNAAGIPARALSGSDSQTERNSVLAELRAGTVKVVANCSLFGEGWDEPSLETVILARPTASLSLHRQQIGRVMRPFPGKKDAIVIDAAGNLARHGAPWEPIEWSLDSKAERDPKLAALKRCAQCFALYETNPCPECGWTPPPKEIDPVAQVDGHLEEWEPVERDAWYEREVRVVSRKGWKLGAARVRFKEKTGSWPNGRRLGEVEREHYRCPRTTWQITEDDETVNVYRGRTEYRCGWCLKSFPNAAAARTAHAVRSVDPARNPERTW